MDFSTSVFMYPIHAVRPYPRFSALHAACCFTRPQDLTRALAPYSQRSCFTRPQDLELREAHLERCVAAFEPRRRRLLLYPSAGLYSRFSALHATQLPYPASGPYPRFSSLHATQPPPSPSLLGRAGVGLPTSYPSTFSSLYRRAPFPHGSTLLFASAPYRDGGRDSFF